MVKFLLTLSSNRLANPTLVRLNNDKVYYNPYKSLIHFLDFRTSTFEYIFAPIKQSFTHLLSSLDADKYFAPDSNSGFFKSF